jgi:hypothetical protein
MFRLAGVVAVLGLGVSVRAADPPPVPKPAPEMEALKQQEGTWDVTVKMGEGPAA